MTYIPDAPAERHHPTILRGGGASWAECSCGWQSRSHYRTRAGASAAWAEHMKAVAEAVTAQGRVAGDIAGERDAPATHARIEGPAASGPSSRTSGEVYISAAHSAR